MYKSRLQELCHKNQWGLPKYTSKRYGPDHNPRFGASVSVNGTSFDSLLASKSNKEAHNHAAIVAFLHFTSPPSPSGTTFSLFMYIILCSQLGCLTIFRSSLRKILSDFRKLASWLFVLVVTD